jgi:hypothetical protein
MFEKKEVRGKKKEERGKEKEKMGSNRINKRLIGENEAKKGR